nr:Chain B, co-regulator peptide [synthetic construct]4OIU_B Chain B, co-regulator peptide [synthetic construct]4OKX_B Chain B, co-regulator peptide [synthetic construct]
ANSSFRDWYTSS